jgi:hypothetical protein
MLAWPTETPQLPTVLTASSQSKLDYIDILHPSLLDTHITSLRDRLLEYPIRPASTPPYGNPDTHSFIAIHRSREKTDQYTF